MNKPIHLEVVVPCYNHAAFVGQTLRSIIGQTRSPEKLLVIDDGSTDDSAKIIENALKDCPFPSEFISRSNKGLSATLNEGFEKTSGNYFAYLGADDLWLPEFLDARVKLLESRPDVVLAHGNAYVIDENTRVVEDSADWNTYIDDYAWPLLERGIGMISSTVFYQRSVLEKFSWNEKSRLEDFELYLQLIHEGVFAFDPRSLSTWRMHRHNTSHDTGWMLDEVLAAHRKAAGLAGLPDSVLKRSIAKTSLEYALLFARKGNRAKGLSLLMKNWPKSPSLSKPVKILGHCLMPASLKTIRNNKKRETADERFEAINQILAK